MIHLTIPDPLLLHLVQQVDTLLLFLAAPKTVVLNYLLYQDLSDTRFPPSSVSDCLTVFILHEPLMASRIHHLNCFLVLAFSKTISPCRMNSCQSTVRTTGAIPVFTVCHKVISFVQFIVYFSILSQMAYCKMDWPLWKEQSVF